MRQIKNVDDNNTIINKNMILSIIGLAAKEIDGVVDLYHSTRLWFLRLVDKNTSKGVRIKYTNNGLNIDVYVVVKTDVEVSEVVYRIQQNIKNNLSTLLPLKIATINVHVKDAVRAQQK